MATEPPTLDDLGIRKVWLLPQNQLSKVALSYEFLTQLVASLLDEPDKEAKTPFSPLYTAPPDWPAEEHQGFYFTAFRQVKKLQKKSRLEAALGALGETEESHDTVLKT